MTGSAKWTNDYLGPRARKIVGNTRESGLEEKLRSVLFCKKSFFLHFTCILPIFYDQPFCLFPHYPARTLRALGLFLADGAPTEGRGKTFWRVGKQYNSKITGKIAPQK